MGKLSSCDWVFCKNDLHLQNTFAPLDNSSHYCMVEQVSTYTNIDMAKKHLFTKKGLFNEMTALTKVALYQHILKAAYQGSCVLASARTGEMIIKSSKLWWIELDTGMYSPLWTIIPQASIASLDLVRYGCLQGCRSRTCSSPVYDSLCLWWQL